MLHFDSDYMEGAHPAILERLAATNFDQTSGYGTDEVCAAARERIREACACPHANVYFLVGGTQANAAVADQILRPWEGIVSATTGHITAHEAGAVEACGRKTLPLPHVDGKLVAADVRALCEAYWGDENREHIVAPGAVYISHPTEYGTVYSLAELEALAQVCRDFDMRLFMDGARLGYGLAAVGADVTLADIARLCDAFYIGGTKVGAFCGEAVVFTKPGLDDHFFTLMKKRGALLAKVRPGGRRAALPAHRAPRRRAGAAHRRGLPREGLRAGHRLADEPAVRHPGRRDEGAPGRTCVVRLLGAHARRPHRRPLRHQLGHPSRKRERASGAAVTR